MTKIIFIQECRVKTPDRERSIDTLLLISGSEIGKRATQDKNIIEAAKKIGVKWVIYTSLLYADISSINLAGEYIATEAALQGKWYSIHFAAQWLVH